MSVACGWKWGRGAVRSSGRAALFALLWAAQPVASSAGATSDPELFVIRRGWHVDIAFATAGLDMPLGSIAADLPGSRYLVFGFGDRRYLLAPHRGVVEMVRALWPAPGLILATGLTSPPQAAFGAEQVAVLRVSAAEFRAAEDQVWNSLAHAGGGAVHIAPGPYAGSLFYDSIVVYSAINTCNTWVASLLHASGIPIRARGVIFAWQLWRQSRRIGRVDHARSIPQRQGGVDPSEQTADDP